METTAEKERSGGVDLTLSELAATKVREYLAEEELDEDVAGLRVSVVPGGCSGFEYSLTLEDEREADDFVVETRGITLYVDPFSAQYLSGTSIGFKSSFQGAGFTFQNPNATGGCGCGSSFAV
ncbi:MAG: HesB/IscA family protein [Gemmatimonadota bacterium]